jgi:threonine/homoserine/homoserine lactone efflux protein
MSDQVEIWRPFLSLILASIVVMGSPGPSTMSVTAVGAAFGLRRSARYLWGLVLGTIAVLLAVAAGVVSVLLSMPRLAPVLLIASAAYMLYLAFRIATAPPLSRRSETITAPSFAAGFLLAVANPKAYVAIAAVFAGTTLAAAPTLDAVLKTAVLAVMIVVIHVCWLLAGTSLARVFYDPVSSRIANLAFAVVLVVMTFFAFF